MTISIRELAASILDVYEIPLSKRKKVIQEVSSLVDKLKGKSSEVAYDSIVGLIERRIDTTGARSFFNVSIDKPISDEGQTLSDIISEEAEEVEEPQDKTQYIAYLESLPDPQRLIAEYTLKRAVSLKHSKFKGNDGFWLSRSAKRVLRKSIDFILDQNQQYSITNLDEESWWQHPLIKGNHRINLTAIKKDYEKNYKKLGHSDIRRLRILSLVTFNDTTKFHGEEEKINTDEIYRLARLTPLQKGLFDDCIVDSLDQVAASVKYDKPIASINDAIVKTRWKLRLAAQMLYPEYFKSGEQWKKLKPDTVDWYKSTDTRYSRFLQTDLLKKLRIIIDHLYDSNENFYHALISGNASRIRSLDKLSHIIGRLFDGSAYRFIEVCNKQLYEDLDLASKRSGISRFTDEEIVDLVRTKLTLSNHIRINQIAMGSFIHGLKRWKGVTTVGELSEWYEKDVLGLTDKERKNLDWYTEIFGFDLFTFTPKEAVSINIAEIANEADFTDSERKHWDLYYGGVTYEDIGSQLQVTLGSAKFVVANSRRKIRLAAEDLYGDRLVSGRTKEEIEEDCRKYLAGEYKTEQIKKFLSSDFRYKIRYIITHIADKEGFKIDEIPEKFDGSVIKKYGMHTFFTVYFMGSRVRMVNFAFENRFRSEDFPNAKWTEDSLDYLYSRTKKLRDNGELTSARLQKERLSIPMRQLIGNMPELHEFLDTYQPSEVKE